MYTAHVAELPMIGDDDEHEDEDLDTRVSRAWCVHQWDPTVPLVKLGRFEGIRAIGSGSFGVVFKVRDPELDREVALKLCKVASDADQERMLREARMLAKLSHPNVVAIHEVGLYDGEDEYEGSAFIVMELLEGTTGRRLIEARPRWEDAVDFYGDAARGLAAAHAAGVVHGDFKPSNVIRADKRTRVVDFGLGHSFEPEGEGRYKGRGTLPYMAPELLEGGVSSPLADQWALCVSLWETLERVRPFDGRSALSLLENISAQRFNVSSSKSMPPRLRAALRKGLAFEPSERWPDMLTLADELEAIRADTAATGVGRLRPPGGVLVHTLVGVVLGAMAVALLMILGGPKSPPPNEGSRVLEARPPTTQVEAETSCELSAHPFHDPSVELEEVCQMIREDQITQAQSKWRAVRDERASVHDSGQSDTTIMYIASETRIVMDTCAGQVQQARTAASAERARHCSEAMSSLYELDIAKIGLAP